MKKSKIISILQTDNSVYTNSLIRGLLAINTYNNKKNKSNFYLFTPKHPLAQYSKTLQQKHSMYLNIQ